MFKYVAMSSLFVLASAGSTAAETIPKGAILAFTTPCVKPWHDLRDSEGKYLVGAGGPQNFVIGKPAGGDIEIKLANLPRNGPKIFKLMVKSAFVENNNDGDFEAFGRAQGASSHETVLEMGEGVVIPNYPSAVVVHWCVRD